MGCTRRHRDALTGCCVDTAEDWHADALEGVGTSTPPYILDIILCLCGGVHTHTYKCLCGGVHTHTHARVYPKPETPAPCRRAALPGCPEARRKVGNGIVLGGAARLSAENCGVENVINAVSLYAFSTASFHRCRFERNTQVLLPPPPVPRSNSPAPLRVLRAQHAGSPPALTSFPSPCNPH